MDVKGEMVFIVPLKIVPFPFGSFGYKNTL
jgi:hypothetical protein